MAAIRARGATRDDDNTQEHTMNCRNTDTTISRGHLTLTCAHLRPDGFSWHTAFETISPCRFGHGLCCGYNQENAMSNPSRWVLVNRFAEVTGYSENAVRHKVKGGIWVEGRIWRKAPDGRIFLNLAEFERWVESTAHATSFYHHTGNSTRRHAL